MSKPHQFELPQAGDVFNLSVQEGVDPVRVIMDNLRKAEEQAAAREYELKMQRTFTGCPGFIGGDAPQSEQGTGYVVVDCSKAMDAVGWLKRRFHVDDHLEPDVAAGGLRVAIKPRSRHHGPRKVKVSFAPPEQFNLPLE